MMHRGVAGVQAHTVAGKIYLLGGLNGRQSGMHHVDVYDPLLDTFTKGPQNTAGMFRLRYASAVVGSRIYVIGGLPQNDPQGSDVAKLVQPSLHLPCRAARCHPRLPVNVRREGRSMREVCPMRDCILTRGCWVEWETDSHLQPPLHRLDACTVVYTVRRRWLPFLPRRVAARRSCTRSWVRHAAPHLCVMAQAALALPPSHACSLQLGATSRVHACWSGPRARAEAAREHRGRGCTPPCSCRVSGAAGGIQSAC